MAVACWNHTRQKSMHCELQKRYWPSVSFGHSFLHCRPPIHHPLRLFFITRHDCRKTIRCENISWVNVVVTANATHYSITPFSLRINIIKQIIIIIRWRASQGHLQIIQERKQEKNPPPGDKAFTTILAQKSRDVFEAEVALSSVNGCPEQWEVLILPQNFSRSPNKQFVPVVSMFKRLSQTLNLLDMPPFAARKFSA